MPSGHDPSLSRRVHRLHAGGVCRRRRRVIGELGGSETDRVRTALDEGWAEIIDAPSPTDGDAVAASDIARRTIANETDQAEHEAEKTDAILAGLAIQYVRDRSTTGVVVLTDDQPARKGIENAVRAQGYTDAIVSTAWRTSSATIPATRCD